MTIIRPNWPDDGRKLKLVDTNAVKTLLCSPKYVYIYK